MNIQFLPKKISILLPFLIYTLLGISQETIESFEEKWIEAQTHVEYGQMENLIVNIKEMEGLADSKNKIHLGKMAYLNGEYWHGKEEWSKAISALNKSLKYLQRDTSQLLVVAETYLLLGSCHHELEELDESLLSYQKSLALKQEKYKRPHVKLSNLYFNIGYLYQEKEAFIQSDNAFESGLAILRKLYPLENVQFADFYDELGYNAFSKSNFDEANKFLQKALFLKQKELGAYHENLAFTYRYIGNAYFENEFFAEAINYFYKALQIIEKQQERDVFREGMLHYDIGLANFMLKEYDKALESFDKALVTDRSNPFLLPAIHRFRGVEASIHNKTTAANIHFDLAVEGFKKIKKNGKDYLLNTYKDIAKHHASTNNLTIALETVEKAIELGKKHYREKPINFFELYKLKGSFLRRLKKDKKALDVYAQAFKANGGTKEKTSLTIRQLKNLVSLNLEYAELYLGQEKSKVAHLIKIDSLLYSTISLVEYINKNYQERSTKENFIDEYHRVFSLAIKNSLDLYRVTKERSYLEAAFTLSEKSKSLILLETIKNINAFELAGIPTDIIEKEKQLRYDITYLENRRYEENQRTIVDRVIIRDLNGAIFDLKQERQALLNKIGEEYPDYYQLKFEPTFTSISEIQQKMLNANQTILEYFIDEEVMYAFVIQKESFKVFDLPITKDIGQKINQFRESIYSYRPTSGNNRAVNSRLIQQTNQLGFELYQALVQPIQHQLTKRIILITDGVLSYLPFDALLTAAPNDRNDFANVNYLLETYQISYAHSVNWLSELYRDEKKEFDQNFVGIAPVFKGVNSSNDIADFRGGLGPLKYNQEEVDKIKRSIGGTVIKGIIATRKTFLDYLQKGQILHLATHGKSNDKQGEYSYLAFSEPQDTTDGQFLYVKDLFNLTIPADLVVLSACETGLGEMKRGEGIVGIGKGFSYAGAKSMVTTLWRVSDNSTANFMPLFYKNLKKGLPKDEALWKAKREFVRTNRSVGHPFFWAGYVAYGNMHPIEFQHSNWTLPFLIGGLIVLGLIIFMGVRFFRS